MPRMPKRTKSGGSLTAMSRNAPLRTTLLGLFTLGALAGCADEMSDLKIYVEEVKARTTRKIEPIPEITPYVNFTYPQHSIDPFDASIIASAPEPGKTPGVQIDTDRVPEFLESFPIDTLRMVGTLEQDKTLWALIKTPDGTIQRVKKGNYMGQHNGKITEITEAQLKLKEYVPDGFGGYLEREGSVAISE